MSRSAIPQALSKGVFGWDAVRLSDAYTRDELDKAVQQIRAEPSNANPAHAAGTSAHLLTKAAEKRIHALCVADYYRQKDGKA